MKRISALLLLCCMIVSVSCNNGPRCSIVSHRGFWNCEDGGMSQNSIAALKAAQDNGFWGSECDVHLTADGEIIVNHDPTIDGLAIADTTYSELSGHLLPNGEKRPTLDEYLSQAEKSKTVLVLEFKAQANDAHEDELVDKSIACLKEHGLYKPKRVAFISFSHHICLKLAAEAPEFKNQYLNGDIAPEFLHAEGINGIDYHYGVILNHPEWVAQAHSYGMDVNVWTVDDTEVALQLLELGVDAITTNVPKEISALLR